MTSARADQLQMVRAEIDMSDFNRWSGIRRFRDPDHAMHCLLTECFGGMAPKPFRLIAPSAGTNGVLYGYTTADAETLKEEAQIVADPLQFSLIRPDRLATKPMPTEWRIGKRLGFETRARPVRRRARGAEFGQGKEFDAFLLEAVQHPKDGMDRDREQVYVDWLSEQFSRFGGASLITEMTRVVSFRRARAFRRQNAGYTEGPDVVMRGEITVTDSDAFNSLLARGVGRHRSYGYGMLLLRPAR